MSTEGRGGTHHPTPQDRNLATGGEQARESQAHSNIHTCNAGRVMIVFILPECSGPPPCALVPRVPVWAGQAGRVKTNGQEENFLRELTLDIERGE